MDDFGVVAALGGLSIVIALMSMCITISLNRIWLELRRWREGQDA